ncbi:MAG: purine-binding chemotaxis protein CheW [Chroococcidiopsidaceae cyanobacterium CP_BM_ER_R8_30]|nr:purine-binding chemotaxis protein CheW [Chroococcidiopsidaceae cyanobacterium CP_BM_ER_R8_30]
MKSDFLPGGILVPSNTNPTAEVGQSSANLPFLRFRLVPDTSVLLPVQQITEVITIATHEIVPIPNLPAWVMGVHNWRGEVLWMVDLGQLIGLDPLYQHATNHSSYTAIAISETQLMPNRQAVASQTANRKLLGLVVNQVEDMEWLNLDAIQSPPPASVTPELVPFLRGLWLKSNGEILTVLDSRSILAAMP